MSFIEDKLLKKARYNIARLKTLYPDLVGNKEQESRDEGQEKLFDNSKDEHSNCKKQINRTKVRITLFSTRGMGLLE